ncbi:MAG: integrase family protein [Amycolatopsis sp.]|uniref:hypothetical protein n=1 Tax=Amycolatopsis sp. TaxID=37632 RepID=UPI0026264C88|nr:hypothetical protein [Amycolatopsis sp.]MCU1679494.1 integrase family protein [Amycolatopsis sp.]
MTAEQAAEFQDKVDVDLDAARDDLPVLIRLLFGTGARIGEVLGLCWRDVNLTDHPTEIDGQLLPPSSVWINGNIVNVPGIGTLRHPGKTPAANRLLGLPHTHRDLLLTHRPADAAPDDPIFRPPTKPASTFRHPDELHHAIRRLRDRIGYPHFTTHRPTPKPVRTACSCPALSTWRQCPRWSRPHHCRST